MPILVYVLGLAVFAQGTSEFMLSGLLPGVAGDLDVSIARAGLLSSAFALGMAVGAPIMAATSARWPRRRALVLFLSVFVVMHLVGATTASFGVLLVTRIVAAFANAGFWAVALTTAVAAVEERHRARAIAIVVGGVTVACIAGVPAGAVLGQALGWRSAFWAVALVSLPAVVAILRTVPSAATGVGLPRVTREFRALHRPGVLLTLAFGVLVQGGTFCTLTYLAPLVTEITGLSERAVPIMLVLFGVGSFVGVTLAGRIGDELRVRVMFVGTALLVLGWAVLGLLAGNVVAAAVLVSALGVVSFGTGSALISRVMQVARDAPNLAGSFATAAFNTGATLGPWLGGEALAAGFGYRSPVWVSAGLAVVAFGIAAGWRVHERRTAGRTALRR